MGPELQALLADMIPRRVAQKRREVRGMVSTDDLEQAMWLAAVEAQDTLERHREGGNDAAIREVLNAAAAAALRAEDRQERAKRAAKAGYETHDEIFYSLAAIRRLLPVLLDQGVTEHPPAGREHSGRVAGGGVDAGDHLVTMIDVKRAFGAVSAGKRKILTRYFAFPQGSGGFTHSEIAGRMGMEPGALSARVHHALRAIQRELGGQNPWQRGPARRRSSQPGKGTV